MSSLPSAYLQEIIYREREILKVRDGIQGNFIFLCVLLNSQSLLLIQVFFFSASPFHNIIFCHYHLLQSQSLVFLSLHRKWSYGFNIFYSFFIEFTTFFLLLTQHFSRSFFVTSSPNYKNLDYKNHISTIVFLIIINRTAKTHIHAFINDQDKILNAFISTYKRAKQRSTIKKAKMVKSKCKYNRCSKHRILQANFLQ